MNRPTKNIRDSYTAHHRRGRLSDDSRGDQCQNRFIETEFTVRISLQPLARRLSRLRTYGSFLLVAGAQFLSPAAAADPASKIDPPAWSHHDSKEELQAYGARATAQEPEKTSHQMVRDVRLRRL